MPIEVIQSPREFLQWAKLLELLHAAFAYQNDRIAPPSSLHKLDVESLAQKAQEEELFLATENGELIGCAFAKVEPASVYIGKFAVLPARQGQGVGRRLMREVENFAKTTGKAIMELETRIELVENHKTFAAFGFAKTAEHAHAGYTRATSITMQKALATLTKSMSEDPWLERWIPALKSATSGSALLEIGCGSGQDTRTLLVHGLKVVAFDLSHEQVAKARLAAPGASISVQSVLEPFPLEGAGIGAVVASLSLHYFTWQETASLVERVRRTLKPGGILLARFNSTEDVNYGAVGHQEIEPGLFLVEGQKKRFFSRDSINRLFGPAWQIQSMQHMVTHKYQSPKSLWEVVVASGTKPV